MTELAPAFRRQGGMRPSAIALVLVGCVLAGCGAPGGTAIPSANLDVEGSWQLVTGTTPTGAVPIVAGHPITLTITGTELSGTAACNTYGGRFSMRGGGLAVEDLGMTAMGCEPAVAASEAAYTAALATATAIGRDGDQLVLAGPGLELRFASLPPPPTAELVDTVWVLETLVVGDVAGSAMGKRATLELRSDGTFNGSTGCRSFEGTWVEQGERIAGTSMAMDDLACPDDLAEQDGHVVSVVGDGFVPSIEGDLLTLSDPGGAALVYRAQE